MKQMNKSETKDIIIILVLFAAVAVAACTGIPFIGGGQAPSWGGVVINRFDILPTEIDETDIADFFLEVENTGTTTATCVRADLYGIEGWRKGTQEITIKLGGVLVRWDPGSGDWNVIGQLNVCDAIGGISIFSGIFGNEDCTLDFEWNDEGFDFEFFWRTYMHKVACNPATFGDNTQWGRDTLEPRKLDGSAKGQIKTASWALKPVDLPEGTHSSYPITARVSYDYKTTGSINIKGYSESEADRRNARGESITDIANAITQEQSPSPLQLNLISGEGPIVIESEDLRRLGAGEVAPTAYYTYTFELVNVGNGFPITASKNGVWLGEFSVNGPGARFKECFDQENKRKVRIDKYTADKYKLRADGTVRFSCVVGIDVNEWRDREIGLITILYDIRYFYYTEAEQIIKVKGKRNY